MPNKQISPASTVEKLLILGCGDLGQRLACTLDHSRYQITGIRRSALPAADNLSYRQLDLSCAPQLEQLLSEHWDLLVMTLTPSERSDQGYKAAYVDITRRLISTLNQLQRKPRLLVFVSSTSVYGQEDGSWVNENSPAQPQSFNGKRLLEAEQLLIESGQEHCIVRFSGIYGPGRTRLLDQIKSRQVAPSSAFTNRIHADDCARVLAHLIERHKYIPLAPLYLASDSAPTPLTEVATWLGAQLNITDPFNTQCQGERGSKRISNHLLLSTGFQLRYPEFRCGYAELLTATTPQQRPAE